MPRAACALGAARIRRQAQARSAAARRERVDVWKRSVEGMAKCLKRLESARVPASSETRASRGPLASLASMIEVDQRVLETGLPVVGFQMPGTRSVTLLAEFDAGARTRIPAGDE